MAVLNKKVSGIPAGAVYIGRGSRWGNPFRMQSEADRLRVCTQYAEWLDNQLRSGDITLADLATLHGRDLVCFCAPKQCHGHILEDRAMRAARALADAPVSLPEFKLIVAGGRDFTDYARAEEEILRLGNNELSERNVSIVCGLAKGADAMGKRFAETHGVQCHDFPADWERHGRSAGHRRNREMGDFADGLLAFWDGTSRGTKGMIDYMKSLGKSVRIISY